MKIIFVSNALKVGGAEKFLLNIINGFAARGYQPVLFILDDDNPLMPVLDKSIKTYIFKKKFRYDIGISLKIRRAILREKATKVICIEIYPFFLSKLLFQFNNKIKFYISLHNSLPIHKKQHIFDIAYLKVFRKPDTAIFICNYQKDCFRKKYNFNPFKSVVIYNGIDTHFFSSSTANNEISPELFRWKEKIGLPEISKTILMIGRLSREKAHIFAKIQQILSGWVAATYLLEQSSQCRQVRCFVKKIAYTVLFPYFAIGSADIIAENYF